MAPFQILRAYRLLAILWIAVGCVSETASDGHGMRVATVGFPTIYQGSATLRTSRTNRFTYTVAGMIDHVDTVDSSGTLRTTYYKYDDARRRRQADSPEGVLTWQRDAQGNIIAMQGYRRSAVGINAEVTGGTTTDVDVAYGYDAMNRLSSVTDRKVSTTRSLGYAFDAAGRVQTATYPNGATNRFTYDARHRLLKTDWWQTNGTLMRAFSYTLGAGGVRVAVNESDPTNSNRRSISWQYDLNGTNQFARLYRLTSETITNLGSLGTEQHLYDLVGNRLSRSVTGFITNSVTNSAWTDNARDELVGDTYDGAGNTTLGASLSLTNPDSYDAENHLILRGTNTSPVVQIDYDAFGNRVKKTVNSGTPIWYLIDDQSPSGYQQVVAEFNSLSSAPLRTYAYGLSLIDIVGGGTTSYPLTDGQGSVRALFSDNAAASLTDSYDFDAYGVLTASTGSTVNNYRYTGQQWDPDLQLYYLRARYYAPTLGRFWSSDSFEGSPSEPASLHKYLYCHDNSVNGIDLTGHEFTLAQSITTLTTAEGLQGMKGGVETKVEWEIRDMAKQLANDYSPSDLNQKLGLEGEEVWTRYLNAIPGFRATRAKGRVSAIGPDVYGVAVNKGRIVVFIGEVKASEGRIPGLSKLEWNTLNSVRQMSSQWLDNYASDILNGVISLGLNGISDDAELRRYISRGQIELYLLGGLREWTNWRIRGFRLLHLGANDVMQDEGGFPEITNEHIVHRM